MTDVQTLHGGWRPGLWTVRLVEALVSEPVRDWCCGQLRVCAALVGGLFSGEHSGSLGQKNRGTWSACLAAAMSLHSFFSNRSEI